MTHAMVAVSILEITGPGSGKLFSQAIYLLVVVIMKRGWIWHVMQYDVIGTGDDIYY